MASQTAMATGSATSQASRQSWTTSWPRRSWQPTSPGCLRALIVTADADALRDKAEAYGQAGALVTTLRAINLPDGFASMTEIVPLAQLITRATVR